MASRIMDEAGPDKVLTSRTVKDHVYGSGMSFEDRGEHELKGIEDKRRLYAVVGAGPALED